MVDVRVGDDNEIGSARIETERGGVLRVGVAALEHSTVDQKAGVARGNVEARAGHLAGGAEERELEAFVRLHVEPPCRARERELILILKQLAIGFDLSAARGR